VSTQQTQITQAEWETLQFAPLWMLSGVGGADANIDQHEVNALLNELSEASLYKNPLVREVLSSVAAEYPTVVERYNRDPRTIGEGLSNVADVLDAYSTAEGAYAFKRALIGIGVEIAKVSGAVFGDPVSVEEKDVLAFSAAALRFEFQ
jgi:hypothetical protein